MVICLEPSLSVDSVLYYWHARKKLIHEVVMNFDDLIKEARSCRRFVEDQRLGAEAIHWLVDCARVAPCARNAQVLRYIAATSEKACDAVFAQTKWAAILKWDGPTIGERPSAYIAILCPKGSGKLVHMDVGISAQTMQLAAHTKGWGCCMHASFNPNECSELFKVPEDMEIGLILAFGTAKEKRLLAPMPENGEFKYWRDEAQVHFVPKRSLEEVLLEII